MIKETAAQAELEYVRGRQREGVKQKGGGGGGGKGKARGGRWAPGEDGPDRPLLWTGLSGP
jgi:DNA invertase Pin-like site-specific DNA recombinase